MNIDFERFPTNQTALRMLRRVSPIYDHSYVGKWLFQVMGLEMEDARLRYVELRLQEFPETADWGLAYWEQRYGIPTDLTKSLEERRRNVLYRRWLHLPMNPARVESIISTMTGRETSLTENVAPYTFNVKIQDIPGESIDHAEVYGCLRRIKPSHQRFELAVETPTHEEILYAAGGFISYSSMELPEWQMDYDLHSRLMPGALFFTALETKLPEIVFQENSGGKQM